MAVQIFYDNNDHYIELTGLQDSADSSYKNGATVEVTLKDASGNNLSGETWPLSMSYVASSNGNYRATLADTLAVVVGNRYTALVTANAGAGLQAEWEEPVKVLKRRST